jgi:hypothetical protein
LSTLNEVLSGVILQQLPAALAQALMTALSQAPSEGKGMCAPCQVRRAEWDEINADAIQFAFAQARQEAGVAEGDPAGGELDILRYLPAELHYNPADPLGKSGCLPMSFPAITTFRGTDLCPMDIRELAAQNVAARRAQQQPQPDDGTAARQAQDARRALLLAPPGMDASTAAKIAGSGIPKQ